MGSVPFVNRLTRVLWNFLKNLWGVVVKYYKRLIYGWGIVFIASSRRAANMGWWGYGGV
jgi:hypothetical protein